MTTYESADLLFDDPLPPVPADPAALALPDLLTALRQHGLTLHRRGKVIHWHAAGEGAPVSLLRELIRRQAEVIAEMAE